MVLDEKFLESIFSLLNFSNFDVEFVITFSWSIYVNRNGDMELLIFDSCALGMYHELPNCSKSIKNKKRGCKYDVAVEILKIIPMHTVKWIITFLHLYATKTVHQCSHPVVVTSMTINRALDL